MDDRFDVMFAHIGRLETRVKELEEIARSIWNDFKKEAWEEANAYFDAHPEVNRRR
jgi:hypothetical protein